MKVNSKNNQTGSILLVGMLVMTVLLAIMAGLLGIYGTKLSSLKVSSEWLNGYYAAESYAEYCAYIQNYDVGPPAPVMENGASWFGEQGLQCESGFSAIFPIEIRGIYNTSTVRTHINDFNPVLPPPY